VLLEAKDGRRIVHQHVGVEDEQAGLVVFAFDQSDAVELLDFVRGITPKDFETLSPENISHILYQLLRNQVDYFDLAEALEDKVLSGISANNKFLLGFEHMIHVYSQELSDQEGVLDLYKMWESLARVAGFFDFGTFFSSTLRMYEDSGVDPYLKARFVIELNKWLIGNEEFADLLVEKLNVSNDGSKEDASVLLDLLYQQSRYDVGMGSGVLIKQVLDGATKRVEYGDRNYFYQKQIDAIYDVKSVPKNAGNFAPISVGGDRYLIYGSFGSAYISEYDKDGLLKTLSPYTKPRFFMKGYNLSGIESDRDDSEEASTLVYEELFDEHKDFLVRDGDDFINVARQKYGFHPVSERDFEFWNDKKVSNDQIANYLFMMRPTMRSSLYEEFEVDLIQLARREQFYFLNYLKKTAVKDVGKMKDFIGSCGVSGLRTFMSLEHGDETLGNDIVAFGTQNGEAEQVFASYSALLDEVEELESFMKKELDCVKVDCVALVKKARDILLSDTHEYLVSAVRGGDVEVFTGLDEKTTKAKALSAALGTYLATGGSSIEDFASFEKGVYQGGEISNDFRDSIQDVYRRNYKTLGYGADAIESLVSILNEKLSQPQTSVRTWEFGDNQTLAFIATTEHPVESSVYLSGLNINPDLRVSQAAKNLLVETVQEYRGKGWTTEAECSPKIFQGYGEMDWVATGVKQDNLNAEPYLLDIAVYPYQEFKSKEMSRKSLRGLVADADEAVGPDGVVVWKTFDPAGTPPLLGQGYVATRMFRYRGTNSTSLSYVFVLEKFTPPLPSATMPQTQIVA
jgi:hypothetical protein